MTINTARVSAITARGIDDDEAGQGIEAERVRVTCTQGTTPATLWVLHLADPGSNKTLLMKVVEDAVTLATAILNLERSEPARVMAMLGAQASKEHLAVNAVSSLILSARLVPCL